MAHRAAAPDRGRDPARDVRRADRRAGRSTRSPSNRRRADPERDRRAPPTCSPAPQRRSSSPAAAWCSATPRRELADVAEFAPGRGGHHPRGQGLRSTTATRCRSARCGSTGGCARCSTPPTSCSRSARACRASASVREHPHRPPRRRRRPRSAATRPSRSRSPATRSATLAALHEALAAAGRRRASRADETARATRVDRRGAAHDRARGRDSSTTLRAAHPRRRDRRARHHDRRLHVPHAPAGLRAAHLRVVVVHGHARLRVPDGARREGGARPTARWSRSSATAASCSPRPSWPPRCSTASTPSRSCSTTAPTATPTATSASASAGASSAPCCATPTGCKFAESFGAVGNQS